LNLSKPNLNHLVAKFERHLLEVQKGNYNAAKELNSRFPS